MAVDVVLALHSSLAPTVFFQGSGTAAVQASGTHLTGLSVPAGLLATRATATLAGVPIRVDAANGTGRFAEQAGGGWSGTMPLLGTFSICATPACRTLSLGVVGSGGTTATPGGTLALRGAPWQTTPITLLGPGFVSVFSGYQLGPGSLPSSTALPGGFLLFLSPAQITIPGLGSVDIVTELGITLRAPEPRVLPALVLGSSLIALGRRKLRPRSARERCGGGAPPESGSFAEAGEGAPETRRAHSTTARRRGR